MSSVLASVLRRILCRSSLQTAATHPSLRLLFFLVISAIFLFCCMSMLRSDERHYLSHSRRRYQLNQVTSNNTSRSRSFHYVGPVPLSEHHRSVNSDSAEILGVLLKSGSTRTSGELGPGDGLRSTTAQPRNDSCLGNLTSSEWLSLQRHRKARLKQVCDGLARNTDSLRECGFRLDGLLIDRSNHILYCAIPKVASSSVKLAFAFMTGQINRTSSNAHYPVHLSSWLRSVGIYSVDYLVENDPVWLKTAWPSLRKFIIVRHPFERLVSAYVDKFTLRNKFTEFFQRRYGRQIVHLYRNRSELRRHKRAADGGEGHDVKFSEFVRFLIDKRVRCSQKLNPHWTSFVDVCHPCLVDYDYIVHFEGLAGEMLHLWKTIYNRTNLEEVLHQRNVGQTRTSDLVAGYMNQLPAEDVEALYELLSIDFKMFEYT